MNFLWHAWVEVARTLQVQRDRNEGNRVVTLQLLDVAGAALQEPPMAVAQQKVEKGVLQ